MEGVTILRNVVNCWPNDTALQPRRLDSSSRSLWEPQISNPALLFWKYVIAIACQDWVWVWSIGGMILTREYRNALVVCNAAKMGITDVSGQPVASSWTSCPLKMGSIGCPQTSVTQYHLTLRYTQEERRFYLHRGGSPKSHGKGGGGSCVIVISSITSPTRNGLVLIAVLRGERLTIDILNYGTAFWSMKFV
jgi:hypothetical protein